MNTTPRRRAQRGITLMDALIALALLSFGLIGVSRMQGRMVTAATDAQLRTTAVQMADELLNTVLVDRANADCYTQPATGSCGSPQAQATLAAWDARAAASLPGTVSRTVVYNAGTGRMTVSLGWTARDSADARLLNVVTDVR